MRDAAAKLRLRFPAAGAVGSCDDVDQRGIVMLARMASDQRTREEHDLVERIGTKPVRDLLVVTALLHRRVGEALVLSSTPGDEREAGAHGEALAHPARLGSDDDRLLRSGRTGGERTGIHFDFLLVVGVWLLLNARRVTKATRRALGGRVGVRARVRAESQRAGRQSPERDDGKPVSRIRFTEFVAAATRAVDGCCGTSRGVTPEGRRWRSRAWRRVAGAESAGPRGEEDSRVVSSRCCDEDVLYQWNQLLSGLRSFDTE